MDENDKILNFVDKIDRELWLADVVLNLLKWGKTNKYDLEYALKVFTANDEYEKCSIIKELIDNGYYDEKKNSQVDAHTQLFELFDNITELKNLTKDFIDEKLPDAKEEEITDFTDGLKDVIDDTGNFLKDMETRKRIMKEPEIIYPPLSEKNLAYYKKYLEDYDNRIKNLKL